MSIASYVFRIVYCGLMGRQYVECFVYDGLSDTDRKEKPVCQEKDSINPAGFKLTGYFFGKRLIFWYDKKIPDYFSVAGAP